MTSTDQAASICGVIVQERRSVRFYAKAMREETRPVFYARLRASQAGHERRIKTEQEELSDGD